MHPAGPLPFPTLPVFLLVAAWERLELIRRGSPRAVSSSCSELCAKVTQTQRGKHRVNALWLYATTNKAKNIISRHAVGANCVTHDERNAILHIMRTQMRHIVLVHRASSNSKRGMLYWSTT